jgi:hypothetical protein
MDGFRWDWTLMIAVLHHRLWSGAADDATPLASMKSIAAFWDFAVIPD